jgi:hypothetical protein
MGFRRKVDALIGLGCGGNQKGEVVMRFKRTFMVYKRDAEQAASTFPQPKEEWS